MEPVEQNADEPDKPVVAVKHEPPEAESSVEAPATLQPTDLQTALPVKQAPFEALSALPSSPKSPHGSLSGGRSPSPAVSPIVRGSDVQPHIPTILESRVKMRLDPADGPDVKRQRVQQTTPEFNNGSAADVAQRNYAVMNPHFLPATPAMGQVHLPLSSQQQQFQSLLQQQQQQQLQQLQQQQLQQQQLQQQQLQQQQLQQQQLQQQQQQQHHNEVISDVASVLFTLGQQPQLLTSAGQMPAGSVNRMAANAMAMAVAMQQQVIQNQVLPSNAPVKPDGPAENQCPVCEYAAQVNTTKKRANRLTKQRKRNPLHRHCASFGYDGRPWCERCAERFRYHIVQQGAMMRCSRESPCPTCAYVLSFFVTPRKLVWEQMDASLGTHRAMAARRRSVLAETRGAAGRDQRQTARPAQGQTQIV